MITEAKTTVAIRSEEEVVEKQIYADICDTFKEHGGNPQVVGVTVIKNNDKLKEGLRYKVEYPDGHIDYFRVDLFDNYFFFATEVN